MLKILSSGIEKIENLKVFLKEEYEKYNDPKKIEAVAGWGYKSTAKKAISLSKRLDVPYIALEDGFLRSLDLGVNGAKPLSISVDPIGCYYNSKKKSLIDDLVENSDKWFTPQLKEQAKLAIELILKYQISKYNNSIDAKDLLNNYESDSFEDNCSVNKNNIETALQVENIRILKSYFNLKNKILILDQCLGDVSLELGSVPSDVADLMIKKAKTLYPNEEIFLKVHPDVLSKKRESLLYNSFKSQKNVQIISSDVSIISLLKEKPVVFTASSQSGFEALFSGCKVHCFGLPFYAGYGLTFDEVEGSYRREKKVSVELLFAAAYFKLCRYVNPITRQRCSVFEIIELLALQKRINNENRGGAVVFGVKRWKYPIMRAFLGSTSGEVLFCKDPKVALRKAIDNNIPLVQWASKKNKELDNLARKNNVKTLYVEDGFLRSVGLGCDYFRPFSLVFDKGGIYYDPTSQSSLEQILNTIKSHRDYKYLISTASKLRKQIVLSKLSKYNVGEKNGSERLELEALLNSARAKGQKIILVPGQVEDDASVLTAGSGISSNSQLLKSVREDFQDAFIIYKPHPDVLARKRKSSKIDPKENNELKVKLYDFEVKNISITTLFDEVDIVCTLTSLSGFEALLRGIKVRVYGRPFYAGWGLTLDKYNFANRKVNLTIDELIAGVLILYPRYYDWLSGQFMQPLDVVFRLQNLNPKDLPKDPFLVRFIRKLYSLRRKILGVFQK